MRNERIEEYILTEILSEIEAKNLQTLGQFLDIGVSLTPCNEEGKPKLQWGGSTLNKEAFFSDVEELLRLYSNGVKCFAHVPSQSGLCVIDLDVKNGKEGMSEFSKEFKKSSIALDEDFLNKIIYVRTPNKGVHFYFKYTYTDVVPFREVFPGVEFIHASHLVYAPGSVRLLKNLNARKSYRLSGNPFEIQVLPQSLYDLLCKKREVVPRPFGYSTFEKKYLSRRTFEGIDQDLYSQGIRFSKGNRNYYIYKFSLYARKLDYSRGEVLFHLLSKVSSDFSSMEISRTVVSAYSSRY